ncbi:Phage capsid family protein [Aquisphaera giovannonii]|uniref:Phage capsid family protein n=1 Tax=Aquisphaera giovannonii TaxID=406548 RepID=A0A5B9WBE8_9BACT|nr:phage major capsid protein [Aquisphaera giovannonii]QEH37926.1 Phage capsid family protein [Aquisphaera giovannonii]
MSNHQYSLFSAIKRCVDGKRINSGGFEGEAGQALARSLGISPQGFLVPIPALLGGSFEERALDTTAGSGAIYKYLAGTADILRPKLVCGLAGAFLGDLRSGETTNYGQVQLPRKLTAAQTSWVNEAAAPGSSTNPTTAAVVASPRTVAAYVDITTRMLSQGGPAVERMVIDDLITGAAVEIDRAALNGSGSSGQPTGILQTSGIGSVALGTNGGVPTRATLVAMEKAVAAANGDAAASASLGWVASVATRSKMRSIDGSSAGSGAWLWSDADRVLGKPAWSTGNMPDNTTKGTGTNLGSIVYADWSNLVIQLFSVADVLVDPYKASTLGVVRVNLFQDVDILVRQPAAFCAATDIVTS